MEMVLNGGFRPETAAVFKPNVHYYNHHGGGGGGGGGGAPLQQQQGVFDDMSAVNGQVADDFCVDDLLDFSNVVMDENETEEPQKQQEVVPVEQEAAAVAVAVAAEDDVKTTVSNVSCTTNLANFGSFPPTELTVPADDLENLEWLSHFVEDSFSEYSMTCPVTKPPPVFQHFQSSAGQGSKTIVEKKQALIIPVHTKARTKRVRSGSRVWSLGSPSLTETSSGSSSSSSSTTSSYQLFFGQAQIAESLLGKPPAKKQKKKPTSATSGGGDSGGQQRRCSHCGVQKTPQWRAGPLGSKSLCNACGVRFKSGRLLPEYRPACSPTFSSELHSNSHRKVLEMRQKKDDSPGMAPPVQSF